MPDDPFDPDERVRFVPAAPATRQEVGGVLERTFAREGGKDLDEQDIRRLHFAADEALREAEINLSLAREAESAMALAAERYGRSSDPADLAEVERWKSAAEDYRRRARECRERAENLRQRIT